MRAAAVACVLLGTVSVCLAPAQPASASTSFTLNGTAICISGEPVVGVWVDSSKGGSGFATFTRLPGHQNAAYYSRLLSVGEAPTLASVTVGCGGSESDWASSNPAPGRAVSGTYIYNVRCDDRPSGLGSCSGAPYPDGAPTNHFAEGYCTWGAAYKWSVANGTHANLFPSWLGDAYLWNDHASDQHFRVVSVPNARSIAVWEPNVGGADAKAGHVAWVTKVWVEGSIIWFRVREMNWTYGWNTWDTRDVQYASGMSFIVAPAGPFVA